MFRGKQGFCEGLANRYRNIGFFFSFGGECVCVYWEDWWGVRPVLLCLELEAEAELVASSVDVLAIEQSRQCQLDACGNMKG